MNSGQALAFVQKHGVVLAAGKGPVPCLAEAIAGEPIKGSWWAHPEGKQIFRLLQELGESSDVLTCRLVGNKITLVHRRLWPALVRSAEVFPRARLTKVHQVHTAAGHHENVETRFPGWVPGQVQASAAGMSLEDALRELGPWATTAKPAKTVKQRTPKSPRQRK